MTSDNLCEGQLPEDARSLRDRLWASGEERGRRWAAFIEAVLGGLTGKVVLDLGCGEGGITVALAARAAFAWGVDNGSANVSRAASRARAAPGARVRFARGDALRLPFRGATFDIVLMSGLLEWMGFAQPEAPPRVAQLRTLVEVRRVLAPGGYLFLGIENRWFPKFLVRSPHQHVLLALLLPGTLAWRLPKWVFGQRVHERLYGQRGLQQLVEEAGFRRTELFLPVFGYQFPREIVPARDARALRAAVARTAQRSRDAFESVADGGRWGRSWFRVIARLGLQAWLAPSLLVVAQK